MVWGSKTTLDSHKWKQTSGQPDTTSQSGRQLNWETSEDRFQRYQLYTAWSTNQHMDIGSAGGLQYLCAEKTRCSKVRAQLPPAQSLDRRQLHLRAVDLSPSHLGSQQFLSAIAHLFKSSILHINVLSCQPTSCLGFSWVVGRSVKKRIWTWSHLSFHCKPAICF
jgi:hypothetical protein